MRALLWVCLVLSLWSAQVHSSQSVAMNVGDGRSVIVPAPPGLYALGASVPGYRKYIEDREAPNRQLLEVFLTKNDLGDVVAGNSPSRERMLTVEIMHSGTSVRASAQQFESATASVRAMDQTSVDKAYEAALKSLRDLYRARGISSTARPTRPVFLGQIVNEPEAVAVAERLTVEKASGTGDVVVIQAYIFVHERIIALTVNATAHGQEDIDWAKNTTTKLVADIQRLNAH